MCKWIIVFLCISGIAFGVAVFFCRDDGKTGVSPAPAIEVKVLKRAVEGGEGSEAYIMIRMQVDFIAKQTTGEVIFLTSKSKFGGTRIGICAPADTLALRIQPAIPEGGKKFDVSVMNKEMRGFVGKFEPDAALSAFTYELPDAGETLSAPVGEPLVLAEAKGGKDEFFRVFIRLQSVDSLIETYPESGPLQKQSALEKICRIGNASAVGKLFSLLKGEPDPQLRMLILGAAEAVGNEAAIDPAISYLEVETHPEPRSRIYNMLGNFPTDRGFEILKAAVSSEKASLNERIYATLSLGHYDREEAHEILLGILLDDSEPYELRGQAASALAEHPCEEVLAKVKDYHGKLEAGTKVEKLFASFMKYLEKALAGEIDEHRHDHSE